MRRISCRLFWVLLLGATGCSGPARFDDTTTDLFHAELWVDDGLVMLGEPSNVTSRTGYDNQPAFMADGEGVLYISRDRSQSDVYMLRLDDYSSTRLTDGPEREYSPRPLHGADGYAAIRIRSDGVQQLWAFPAGDSVGAPVDLSTEHPVNYYIWAGPDQLALILGDASQTLVLAQVGGGPAQRVATNVGRSLEYVPGRPAVSFVHKQSVSEWWVKLLDLESGQVHTVARTLQGREDHAWTPSGGLVMALGSRVYLWKADGGESWEEVADFSDEMSNITRLAISPAGDQIILVANP